MYLYHILTVKVNLHPLFGFQQLSVIYFALSNNLPCRHWSNLWPVEIIIYYIRHYCVVSDRTHFLHGSSSSHVCAVCRLCFSQISSACLVSSLRLWMRWSMWPRRWRGWASPNRCWLEEPPHQSNTQHTHTHTQLWHMALLHSCLIYWWTDGTYMYTYTCTYNFKLFLKISRWL